MIEYVTIDNNTYARYLATCHLPNITVIKASNTPPAIVYNRVLQRSTSKYVAFIHSDVTCKGLTEAILKTISAYPRFGALGIVGATNDGIQWAKKGMSYPLVTLDSCLLIVNRDHGLLFDADNFDNFHLFVEEYSLRVQKLLGLEARTILLDGYEGYPSWIGDSDYFAHYSNTVKTQGGAWGEFMRYMDKLKKMYPDAETTSTVVFKNK